MELCFRETIKNLEWNHVEAGFSTALDEIRSEDAMQIYDFFEAVIEESLEDLSAFTVNLKRREERIVMSMSVECKQICGKLPDDMELMQSRILTEHGCFF